MELEEELDGLLETDEEGDELGEGELEGLDETEDETDELGLAELELEGLLDTDALGDDEGEPAAGRNKRKRKEDGNPAACSTV